MDARLFDLPVPVVYLPHYDRSFGYLAYAQDGDAGFDLRNFSGKAWEIWPHQRELIATGIMMAIPRGYQLEIRPRSGTAFKFGLTVLNAPGTIDSGYRGEIKILAVNLGQNVVKIGVGERIAQGVLMPVVQGRFEEVSGLPDTSRGAGGFGSTGVK